MSASTDVVLAFAEQTATGVIPGGAWDILSTSTDSISFDQTTVDSQRRSGGSRIAAATIPIGSTASGEITTEFSEDDFDIWLAAAFANDWDTTGATEDVLSVGSIAKQFSIARQYQYNTGGLDIHVLQDTIVSSLGLTMAAQEIIGLTIGFAAGGITTPAASPWASLNAVSANDVAVTCKTMDSVMINNAESNSIISNITFDLTNETRALYDVRQCSPRIQSLGSTSIGGEITAYHDDESEQWFRDSLNGGTSAIEWTINGGTKTYRVVFPKATNGAQGPDTSGDDVTVTWPFSAVDDSPVIYRSK